MLLIRCQLLHRASSSTATGVTADAVGQVQAEARKRILRAFVGRGLLESFEAKRCWATSTAGFRWTPACA